MLTVSQLTEVTEVHSNPFELLLQASENELNTPGIQKDFFVKLPSNILQHFKTGELLSLKCRNRECSSLRGYPKKPNSIYCSARCQSREQNLRQGRVKNVKLLPPIPAGSNKPIDKRAMKKQSAMENNKPSIDSSSSLDKLNINFLISHNESAFEPSSPTPYVWEIKATTSSLC